jgi:autotransporter adhesin
MIAVPPLAALSPAWAQGPNSTSPATPPSTPTPVRTSLPQLSAVGAGGCAQQYTNAINAHNQNAAIANDVGLASNAAGLVSSGVGAAAGVVMNVANYAEAFAGIATHTARAASWTAGAAAMATAVTVVATPASVVGGGIAMAAAAAAETADAAISGARATALIAESAGVAATVVGVGLQATGVASQIAAQVYTHSSLSLTEYVATLPNCETEFTGTTKVSGGGVDVTGASIFKNDVGVAANVNVAGSVNASQLHATQGISAVGGGIWIGDPNGTTFSSGITIGGGALSGAGVGGAQAFTGHVDAIAIGNNAAAMTGGSIALGLNSSSAAADAIAVGTGALAQSAGGIAIGLNANAVSTNSVAIGAGAIAQSSVAVGNGAQAIGVNTAAFGDYAVAAGDASVAIGNNATAIAGNSVALGAGSIANQPSTVSVGAPGAERRITNVGPGVWGTDAVNLNQLNAVKTYAARGVAAALAVPPIAMPSEPRKFLFTMEGATYDGAVAVGAAVAYRFNEYIGSHIGASVPFNAGTVAVRGGVSILW